MLVLKYKSRPWLISICRRFWLAWRKSAQSSENYKLGHHKQQLIRQSLMSPTTVRATVSNKFEFLNQWSTIFFENTRSAFNKFWKSALMGLLIEPFLPLLFSRLRATLCSSCEFSFLDNCSADVSFALLLTLLRKIRIWKINQGYWKRLLVGADKRSTRATTDKTLSDIAYRYIAANL